MKTTRVIVVGGGFAGIKVVREMANIPGISLTLISDQLDFRYSPALWRTATGGSKRESTIPILDLVAKVNNGRFVQAKVTKIDRAEKIIITEDGQKFDYDFCVLALGVVTSYFGIEGLDVFSYSIKSAHEVERLKRHLHEQLTHDHKFDKSYAIVGAGPTGVELAAALGEYLRKIAKRHKIRADKVKIELIEAADRILPSLSAKAAEKAGKRLEKLGVNVLTKQKVMGATKNTLKVDNRIVHTHTVVWTAGVTNNPFFKENYSSFDIHSTDFFGC